MLQVQHGRYAKRAWHLEIRWKALLKYKKSFTFTVNGDLPLNKVPEGGDTFGVP